VGILRIAYSLAGVSLIAACSALPGEDEQASSEAIAVAGRWKLPESVAAAGAQVRLKYDGAPSWSSRACAGKLKTGADRLGDYLQEEFAAITSVGGYACRQNTANRAKMSVHGTGRALDVFIPKVGGSANNGKGDPVANWLVTNAAEIGVQLVIWDRTVWQANGKPDKQYTGPHPHDDHIHVELTIPAASLQTPWFRDPTRSDAGGAIDLEPEPQPDATDAGASAPPPRPDAGATSTPELDEPEPDEPEPDDPAPPPDPTPPPGSEPTPPPSDTTAPADPGDAPASTDPASEASEEPLPDDEPAEGESEGPTKKPSSTKRRRVDAVPSSGCSAAPGPYGSTLTAPLALAIAGALVRRRRRS